MVGTPYYLSPEIIENKNFSQFTTDEVAKIILWANDKKVLCKNNKLLTFDEMLDKFSILHTGYSESITLPVYKE